MEVVIQFEMEFIHAATTTAIAPAATLQSFGSQKSTFSTKEGPF